MSQAHKTQIKLTHHAPTHWQRRHCPSTLGGGLLISRTWTALAPLASRVWPAAAPLAPCEVAPGGGPHTHVWSAAPPTALGLADRDQRREILEAERERNK
jgi:hypothetical protein